MDSLGLAAIALQALSPAPAAQPDQAPAPAVDAVVAPTGARFASVQAAIDAAPAGGRARWIIRIQPGTLPRRPSTSRAAKRPLALVGDDPAATTITFNRKASDPGADGVAIGTFRSATMFVEGDDVHDREPDD